MRNRGNATDDRFVGPALSNSSLALRPRGLVRGMRHGVALWIRTPYDGVRRSQASGGQGDSPSALPTRVPLDPMRANDPELRALYLPPSA